jgi:hypothetical protein
MDEAPTAGTAFSDFVKDVVAVEEQRRDSTETRARSVVTVSGTLVTLLLGFATLVTTATSYQLPDPARVLVLIAAGTLATSTLAAIWTALPQADRVIDPRKLMQALPERWEWEPDQALKKITATRLAQLTSMQRANDVRAILLLTAIGLQAIAVTLLAVAVIAVLTAAP